MKMTTNAAARIRLSREFSECGKCGQNRCKAHAGSIQASGRHANYPQNAAEISRHAGKTLRRRDLRQRRGELFLSFGKGDAPFAIFLNDLGRRARERPCRFLAGA